MKHFFHRSEESRQTFLLLHGTGGRETDLLPIAGQVDPSLSVLGLRGEIIENGQFRYFARTKDGKMDEASLLEKTPEILDFLEKAAAEYEVESFHLIGYSNGANMATSLLLHRPDLFRSAMLFHPSHPLRAFEDSHLEGMRILMTAGAVDQVTLPGEAFQLKAHLTRLGADVSMHITDHGHELMKSEFKEATKWWKNRNDRERE
ncbi:carboxylesterase [Bacillus sp. AFS015802]|uniref:alpha/beta hydrolase n=1 Tax=Bacillus sp. AFS015802 TaxID=2033486 RepID=UPI000BF461B9|nr:alpha/beta hydrolase [Bacillus sp. AFS015802]PFA63005.1 carboxylesterase [Bacillus sp. AFS015802]